MSKETYTPPEVLEAARYETEIRPKRQFFDLQGRDGKTLGKAEVDLLPSEDGREMWEMVSCWLVSPDGVKRRNIFEFLPDQGIKISAKKLNEEEDGNLAHSEMKYDRRARLMTVPVPSHPIELAVLLHEFGHAADLHDPEVGYKSVDEIRNVELTRSGVPSWRQPQADLRAFIEFPHFFPLVARREQSIPFAQECLREVDGLIDQGEILDQELGALQRQREQTPADLDRIKVLVKEMGEIDQRVLTRIRAFENQEPAFDFRNVLWTARIERAASARVLVWMRELRDDPGVDLFGSVSLLPRHRMEIRRLRTLGGEQSLAGQLERVLEEGGEVTLPQFLQVWLETYSATSPMLNRRFRKVTKNESDLK